MQTLANKEVYEFLKNELKEEGVIIDINDEIFKKIVDINMGTNEDILMSDEGLEYENPHYMDFYEIPEGKWINPDGSIDEKDHVYIHWNNFRKELVDPLKEFYNSKLSEYAEDYIHEGANENDKCRNQHE